MNDATLFCIKFDFGLPLEDIFPANDIHPRLQNLFIHTLSAIRESNLPLNVIINHHDISIIEAFKLKQEVINGNFHYKADRVSPTSCLWLIRHFLGLLPLPLFPKFTNAKVYFWKNLALKCKESTKKELLFSEISWWISKLPKANVFLIYTLINFFRRICLKSRYSKTMQWKYIKAVAAFFVQSLFLRPFQPGAIRHADSLYYPLLYCLIVNWNYIKLDKRILLEKDSSESLYSKESYLQIQRNFHKSLVDISCQTQDKTTDTENSEVAIDEAKLKVSIPKKEENVVEEDSSSNQGTNYKEGKEKFPLNFYEEIKKNSEVVIDEAKLKVSTPKKKENIVEEESSSIQATNYKEEQVFEKEKFSLNCYEEIKTDNTKTVSYKISKRELLKPQYITRKVAKVNRSLVNAVSKVNAKIKSKQENLRDTNKYNLLNNGEEDLKKTQSLHSHHFLKVCPDIKYEKLKTI